MSAPLYKTKAGGRVNAMQFTGEPELDRELDSWVLESVGTQSSLWLQDDKLVLQTGVNLYRLDVGDWFVVFGSEIIAMSDAVFRQTFEPEFRQRSLFDEFEGPTSASTIGGRAPHAREQLREFWD